MPSDPGRTCTESVVCSSRMSGCTRTGVLIPHVSAHTWQRSGHPHVVSHPSEAHLHTLISPTRPPRPPPLPPSHLTPTPELLFPAPSPGVAREGWSALGGLRLGGLRREIGRRPALCAHGHQGAQ
eukprot:282809-Chlamydomonas_euryale.AAC.1